MPGSRRMSVPAVSDVDNVDGLGEALPAAALDHQAVALLFDSDSRARAAATVASVSAERRKPVTFTGPSFTAPRRTARCDTDLSPGTRSRPRAGPAPQEERSDCLRRLSQQRLPLRSTTVAKPRPVSSVRGLLGHLVAGDVKDEIAAQAAADVVQCQVLDVDGRLPRRPITLESTPGWSGMRAVTL